MSQTTGSVLVVLLLLAPLALLFCMFLLFRQRRRRLAETGDLSSKLSELQERFGPIIDLEAEAQRLQSDIRTKEGMIEDLKGSYLAKKQVFDQLRHQVSIFDETLAFAEMGVYQPHFDFNDSEDYKQAILVCREKQKVMVSNKTAVVCTEKWTLDGSAAKGQTMTNRAIRLTLRAFNNECEAAIANVRWNNVNAMEKRIINAQEQVDKLNASNKIFITGEYLRLKVQELLLTHEHRERLKAEKDERAEAARLAREEQKLIRDMERAEEEEAHYGKLLAKAKAEAESIVGPQLDAFNDQISMLERDLAAAHARYERAQAMAEKTRSGYIYIISNIGSFGPDVVKIGLTRRLDPADRVRELGDASVPFLFDTHAIIYSDDAPTLERALHNEFEPVRVNTQNLRKEFFRATLDEVESAVGRLAPEAPFFKDVEAQEYQETLARRNASLSAISVEPAFAFPEAI